MRKLYYAQEVKTFQTPDLGLATTLSLDHDIVGLTASQDRNPQIFFSFEKFDGLDETVNQYWNGQLRVDPKRFAAQFKMVKARLNEKINSL